VQPQYLETESTPELNLLNEHIYYYYFRDPDSSQDSTDIDISDQIITHRIIVPAEDYTHFP
jgi:hypothetical protein